MNRYDAATALGALAGGFLLPLLLHAVDHLVASVAFARTPVGGGDRG